MVVVADLARRRRVHCGPQRTSDFDFTDSPDIWIRVCRRCSVEIPPRYNLTDAPTTIAVRVGRISGPVSSDVRVDSRQTENGVHVVATQVSAFDGTTRHDANDVVISFVVPVDFFVR